MLTPRPNPDRGVWETYPTCSQTQKGEKDVKPPLARLELGSEFQVNDSRQRKGDGQSLTGSLGLVFAPNAPHCTLAPEKETGAGGRCFLENPKNCYLSFLSSIL